MTINGQPRVVGGHILALDYDGCLHPDDVWHAPGRGVYLRSSPGHALFEYAPLLEEALAPYDTVRIVLSTSWVRVMRYSKAVRRLPQGLRWRVVGATYHSEMSKHEFEHSLRGHQVLADISRRKPSRWLAVDDTDEGWIGASRDHLVLTHPVAGISDPQVLATLKAKLLEQFGTAEAGPPPT